MSYIGSRPRPKGGGKNKVRKQRKKKTKQKRIEKTIKGGTVFSILSGDCGRFPELVP